jgi:hypothetical protein
MQEKAPNELCRLQAHGGGLTRTGVVLAAESDSAVFQRDEALVGDGYPVGIARQVLQDLSRSAKGWLGIDYPLAPGNSV